MSGLTERINQFDDTQEQANRRGKSHQFGSADYARLAGTIDLKSHNLAAIEIVPDAYEIFGQLTLAHGGLPRNGSYRIGDTQGAVFRCPAKLHNHGNYVFRDGIDVKLTGEIPWVDQAELREAAELPSWLFPPTAVPESFFGSDDKRPANDNRSSVATATNRKSKTERPVIELAGGNLPDGVDAAEQALIGADIGFYQRGDLIVRPGSALIRTASGQDQSVPRFVLVGTASLTEGLTRAADFRRQSSNGPRQ